MWCFFKSSRAVIINERNSMRYFLSSLDSSLACLLYVSTTTKTHHQKKWISDEKSHFAFHFSHYRCRQRLECKWNTFFCDEKNSLNFLSHIISTRSKLTFSFLIFIIRRVFSSSSRKFENLKFLSNNSFCWT